MPSLKRPEFMNRKCGAEPIHRNSGVSFQSSSVPARLNLGAQRAGSRRLLQ